METSLDMLKNSSISEEDSRLVDSILNELNSNDKEPTHLTPPPQRPQQQQQQPQQQQPQQPQQQQQPQQPQQPTAPHRTPPGSIPPPPNLTQEQFNSLPPEKKQMYMNHKQQYLAQNRPTIVGGNNISILDDLKSKSTLLLLVFILGIMIQSSPLNYILAISPETFFVESGECNLSGVVIKSLVVCILYYVITKYLF